MVKLLDRQFSAASLAVRAVFGAVLGAIAFLFLYYLPVNFVVLASDVLRIEIPPNAAGLLTSLVDPTLPIVGLVLVPVIFLCAVFRGTKAYGPLTIVLSLLFAAYIFLLFHGGALQIDISEEMFGGEMPVGLSISIRLEMALLMLLFLVPTFLGVIKGVLLTLKRE